MRWLLALLLVLAVPVTADDSPLPCSQDVGLWETATLRVWWLHEWPAGERWNDGDSYYNRYYSPFVTLDANAEGHPVAVQWFIDGVLVQTCGDLPTPQYPIFEDGFDSGDTSQWG